jgi:hypothetical protein
MRRRIGSPGSVWLAAGVLLLGSTSCWERNPDFIGAAGSSSGTGSTSTSTSGDTSGAVPTTGMMTTLGVDGTGSTSLEPGTSTGIVSLDSSSSDTGSTTSTSSSSSGGSSTTGAEEPPYPPCMLDDDPVCPRPYEECYDLAAPDFTACTLPCQEDGDCLQPTTGDAPAVCAGANDDQCVIDCSDGATCPDGMECQMVGPGGMFERCLWAS